jgi:hypothetical protein
MTIVVQDDDGEVEDAVSYLTVEELQAYHTARGNSLGTATNTQLEQALVRARDYLDTRFRYVGTKLNGATQCTEWPRMEAYDADRNPVYGIPKQVKEAQAEYALRALSVTTPLNPDPERGAQGAAVQSIMQKADKIEEQITYVQGGAFVMPEYPAADNKLRRSGLARSSAVGTVSRG